MSSLGCSSNKAYAVPSTIEEGQEGRNLSGQVMSKSLHLLWYVDIAAHVSYLRIGIYISIDHERRYTTVWFRKKKEKRVMVKRFLRAEKHQSFGVNAGNASPQVSTSPSGRRN